jgi:hypothetical protein
LQKNRLPILFVAAFTIAFGFLTTVAPALAASSEKVLYSFCSVSGCADGAYPYAGLTFDASGSLYGTTISDGDTRLRHRL